MKRICFDFLIIVVVGTALFGRVSFASFCGYDDFGELNRAVFEDASTPSHIITTTHFGTTKYRPMNRLFTYLCWTIGRGNAFPFRFRNLFSHLVCALCVYAIATLWTQERAIALVSALLFCVDPVANQNVVAALFTNACAYALLLGAFLAFLMWVKSKRTMWIVLAFGLVLIGMFFYEPVIVVFPMMAGYLLLQNSLKKARWLDGMAVWAGGSACVVFIFAAVRRLVISGQNARVPLAEAAHNALLYAGGLFSPIDAVTANQLFGFPLPPAIHLGTKALLAVAFAVVAIGAGLVLLLRKRRIWCSTGSFDKRLAVYLALMIPVTLAPFLLFTPHASETYLYLAVALYSILLAMFLWAVLSSRAAYWSVAAAIILWFGMGTWIRNERVVACAQTADHVLRNLPVSEWKKGEWQIHLFSAPGQTPPRRYGIYNYQGLSTIDPGDPETGDGAQNALELATGNRALKATVIPAHEVAKSCQTKGSCFEVNLDGTVREFSQAGRENQSAMTR